jgi:hypothetical protein
MYRIGLIAITAVLLITAFLGCSQTEPIKEVKAIEEPDYAVNISEALLQSFNTGDYTAYLKNFDATAGKAMTEEYFIQTVSLVQSKVGSYVSKSKVATEVKPDDIYTDVIYKTEFSDEPDGVYVTIAYYVSDNHTYAAGIWFNSPKLFKQ